jgi:DUF1707 SHOCT-like domain
MGTEAGEMDDQQKMRASDRDRQQVVEQLRSALEDGRLTMDEYVDRMEVAYQAATCGDLAPLCADLPASSLPLANLGRRPVRGSAVRRVGWRRAIPAQPTARRAPTAGERLTRSTLPIRRRPQIERRWGKTAAWAAPWR